jgi:hypothetical protein
MVYSSKLLVYPLKMGYSHEKGRYNRQELGVLNIKREGISIKNEGHATYDLMI